MVDVIVHDVGSILVLEPVTEAAERWFAEHVGQDNGFQPYWPRVVAEPRYVPSILGGLLADGLEYRVR